MENKPDYLFFTLRYALRDSVLKIELSILLSLVSVLLYCYFFLISPLNSEYQEQTQTKMELERNIEEKIRLKELAVEYDKTFPIIDVVEEQLSTKFSQAELTRKFDSLAQKQGIEVVSMDTKNGEFDSGYHSYINEIAFKGFYPEIKKMLMSLSELPGLNSVIELHLTKDAETRHVTGTMVLVTVRSTS